MPDEVDDRGRDDRKVVVTEHSVGKDKVVAAFSVGGQAEASCEVKEVQVACGQHTEENEADRQKEEGEQGPGESHSCRQQIGGRCRRNHEGGIDAVRMCAAERTQDEEEQKDVQPHTRCGKAAPNPWRK